MKAADKSRVANKKTDSARAARRSSLTAGLHRGLAALGFGRQIPSETRERRRVVTRNLLLHFRPVQVPARTIRYTHTWGLGGSSAVLFALQALTGILMLFVYMPTPGGAYESIVALQRDVLFGRLVRNMHHWSANLFLIVAVLHMLRVFFTGGFRGARSLTWALGVGLLGCVMLSNLTGYLLPWDQLAYWATTIVTGMIAYVPWLGAGLQSVILGGREIGQATLINFHAAHTAVLPVFITALMAFHFWRIRKARGVVVPRAEGEIIQDPPRYVLTFPHLLVREFVAALALLALVMLLSVFFDAPLAAAANPGMSPNPAKAPWYFMGVQELQIHFHPLFSVVLIPLAACVALLRLPYIGYPEDASGVFMVSARGRRLAGTAAAVAAIAICAYVLADEYWLDFAAWMPGLPAVITNGLLPCALVTPGIPLFHILAVRRARATRSESVQAHFVLFGVALLVLTVIGVWFRGEGMSLTWPWHTGQ